MDKLKPCPFCGKEVRIIRNFDNEISGIFCTGCKVLAKFQIVMKSKETFGENEQKWLDKWNRRTEDGELHSCKG